MLTNLRARFGFSRKRLEPSLLLGLLTVPVEGALDLAELVLGSRESSGWSWQSRGPGWTRTSARRRQAPALSVLVLKQQQQQNFLHQCKFRERHKAGVEDIVKPGICKNASILRIDQTYGARNRPHITGAAPTQGQQCSWNRRQVFLRRVRIVHEPIKELSGSFSRMLRWKQRSLGCPAVWLFDYNFETLLSVVRAQGQVRRFYYSQGGLVRVVFEQRVERIRGGARKSPLPPLSVAAWRRGRGRINHVNLHRRFLAESIIDLCMRGEKMRRGGGRVLTDKAAFPMIAHILHQQHVLCPGC